MKISMITDEATQSLSASIDLASSLGMDGLELRSVEGRPLEKHSAQTLKEYRARIEDAGLAVSNLAGSLFKCAFGEKAIEGEWDKLERLLDAADILGVNTIRGFSFFQGDTPVPFEALADALRRPVERFAERGKVLLLEADPTVHTPNHRKLAQLIRLLDSASVAAIFDPGNCLWDRENERPFPDGYQAVKGMVRHIHIKDAVKRSGEAVAVKVGTGEVDYRGLIDAWLEEGYDGFLSLETHYRSGAQLSEELMRLPGGDRFSEGGLEAMVESTASLRGMIAEGLERKRRC